mmetsp:Transcript_70598/g.147872  ORF Transcript_70598/g.147872 Transcript_70598/m.147872 type:complete len:271 (+) Transcript_70598:451-1263(+)
MDLVWFGLDFWLFCKRKTDLLSFPVVGCVVLPKDRLSKNPGLGAKNLVSVHRQEGSSTDHLGAVGLGLKDSHSRGPRVVLRTHSDVNAALQLKDEIGPRESSTIDLSRIIRNLAGEKPVQTLSSRSGCTNQGGACVGDGDAITVGAERDALPSNRDTLDLHLPEAEFGFVDGDPLQIRRHPAAVMTTEGNFAGDCICPGQEVSKRVLCKLVHLRELPKKAEFGVDSQAIEPQAQHTVKLKGVEGFLCQLSCSDHPESDALRAAGDGVDLV